MREHHSEVQASNIERMLRQMEHSSTRWEKLVFPGVIAFILLASYGFFLVYSVTRDMSMIAQFMDKNMRQDMIQISENMNSMTAQMKRMSKSVSQISDQMEPIADLRPMLIEFKKLDLSLNKINGTMLSMDQSVGNMNESMTSLDKSMFFMGEDMDDLNDSFSSPTEMMKRFVPW